MSFLRPHPHRYDLVTRMSLLDPHVDAHHIYRTQVQLDLAGEVKVGFQLAFYRTFASPRIAALLAHTGEMHSWPEKRAYDTGLWMYELIEHGFDHPRGRDVVRGLNRMHHRWSITNEDYLYVLSTFVVVPTRWIDQVGWRATTAVEREATARFYRELGLRMALEDLPETYEDFTVFFDDYEDRHIAHSPEGEQLMTATVQLMGALMPKLARPFARTAVSSLLEDRLARAVGLRPAGPAVRALVRFGFSVRGALVRRRRPSATPWFVPGRAVRGVYPEGYQLDQLGPRSHPGGDPGS